ncbi:helix-turn-helix domain-containing protein [Mycolicibacterium sp. Dal123E01]
MTPQQPRRAVWRDKGIAATDIAEILGVSRATVYRYLADGTAA